MIDADEHINVKTGDHTLRALTEAVPDAKMISMTWRLFGNAGVVLRYEDRFLSDQFRQAAPEQDVSALRRPGDSRLCSNGASFGMHVGRSQTETPDCRHNGRVPLV